MKSKLFSILAAALIANDAGAAPTLEFGEIRLSTGVRLHYAEQGPADAPVIIALHGYSDSWFSFSGVMAPLADRYKVYALSLRGHGESDKPPRGYTMRDMANDVVAFMDAKGIRRATVIGHSMGSMVAQQVALAIPQRVHKLILVGSATDIKKFDGMSEFRTVVEALTEPVPEPFARDFQVSTIHHPIPQDFLDRTVVESLKLPARVWREVMSGMFATQPAVALGRLGVPTLLIRGDHDTFATHSEQEALLRMIPTARLKTFKDTGHAVHWERPAAFVKDVLAFIEK